MRGRMMNVLALLLVSISLATAGFFTPNPGKHNIKEDVAVKEGHGAVVVEFEKEDGNTKVSISPQENSQSADDQKGYVTNAKEKLSEKTEEAKEKIKEASASVLPDHHVTEEEETHHGFRPRELVCDAYGKCKHKIAGAMERTVEKTKEVVAGTAHEAAEKVYEVEEEAKEAVSEAIGKVKDVVTHTAHKASNRAQEMKESVTDAASEVSSKAKDKVVGKGGEMKEEAERKIQSKKGSLKGIFRRVLGYLMSPARMMGLVGGVLHLLGFASAYGMGLWSTFASSYVLAGVLPRQQFAMVQSKIYPVYFKAMAFSIGMALLGHLMGLKRFSPLSMGMLQGFNLLAAVGMVLVNLMYFEPRATKVMFERMKKEKEEGQAKEGQATMDSATEVAGEATQEKREAAAAAKCRVLQRLNSYSSFLNVATLMSLTWHLVHLGQHVHNVC